MSVRIKYPVVEPRKKWTTSYVTSLMATKLVRIWWKLNGSASAWFSTSEMKTFRHFVNKYYAVTPFPFKKTNFLQTVSRAPPNISSYGPLDFN